MIPKKNCLEKKNKLVVLVGSDDPREESSVR